MADLTTTNEQQWTYNDWLVEFYSTISVDLHERDSLIDSYGHTADLVDLFHCLDGFGNIDMVRSVYCFLDDEAGNNHIIYEIRRKYCMHQDSFSG